MEGTPILTTIARGAEGQITFNEQTRTVTITRRGIIPMLFHGSGGTKTFPLSSIVAVQHRRCGLYAGYLQLSVAGDGDHGNDGGLNRSLSQDENTVVFYFIAQAAFQTLANEIRSAMELRETGTPGPAGPKSVFEQLDELGALREKGYITPADFEAKKAELLARI